MGNQRNRTLVGAWLVVWGLVLLMVSNHVLIGWDNLWPVDQDPDIVVCFEKSPVKLVFWRGIRYGPCWVSENEIWMADQSLETWGNGANDIEGCFEHMQDRHPARRWRGEVEVGVGQVGLHHHLHEPYFLCNRTTTVARVFSAVRGLPLLIRERKNSRVRLNLPYCSDIVITRDAAYVCPNMSVVRT